MSTVYGTCELCQMNECGSCEDNGFTDTNFLSRAVRERCGDCACLTTGEHGEWYCDEASQPCMSVKDCPEGLTINA